jgi:hypothetical protein
VEDAAERVVARVAADVGKEVEADVRARLGRRRVLDEHAGDRTRAGK